MDKTKPPSSTACTLLKVDALMCGYLLPVIRIFVFLHHQNIHELQSRNFRKIKRRMGLL